MVLRELFSLSKGIDYNFWLELGAAQSGRWLILQILLLQILTHLRLLSAQDAQTIANSDCGADTIYHWVHLGHLLVMLVCHHVDCREWLRSPSVEVWVGQLMIAHASTEIRKVMVDFMGIIRQGLGTVQRV